MERKDVSFQRKVIYFNTWLLLLLSWWAFESLCSFVWSSLWTAPTSLSCINSSQLSLIPFPLCLAAESLVYARFSQQPLGRCCPSYKQIIVVFKLDQVQRSMGKVLFWKMSKPSRTYGTLCFNGFNEVICFQPGQSELLLCFGWQQWDPCLDGTCRVSWRTLACSVEEVHTEAWEGGCTCPPPRTLPFSPAL